MILFMKFGLRGLYNINDLQLVFTLLYYEEYSEFLKKFKNDKIYRVIYLK